MKKLKVKHHIFIFRAFCVIAAILAVYGYLSRVGDKPHFAVWIALGVIIAGVAWRAIFVKCPHCGDSLTSSRKIPTECPSCGKSLNEIPTEGENHE